MSSKYQTVLAEEFKRLSAKAIEYKHLIDSAKTGLKKKYYEDKLLKINKKVYNILAQMSITDKVAKPEKQKLVMASSPGKTQPIMAGYMQIVESEATDAEV